MADLTMMGAWDYAISGPATTSISVGRIAGPHVTNARFGLKTLANMMRVFSTEWAALLDFVAAQPFKIYETPPLVRGDARRMVELYLTGLTDRPALFYANARDFESTAQMAMTYTLMGAASRWLMQFPAYGCYERTANMLAQASNQVFTPLTVNDNGRASGGRLTSALQTQRGLITRSGHLDDLTHQLKTCAVRARQTVGDFTVYPVTTEELAVRCYLTALAETYAPGGCSNIATRNPGDVMLQATPLRWNEPISKAALGDWLASNASYAGYHYDKLQTLVRWEAARATTDMCQAMNAYFELFSDKDSVWKPYLSLLDDAVSRDHEKTYSSDGTPKETPPEHLSTFLNAYRERATAPLIPYLNPAWPDTGRVDIETVMGAQYELCVAPNRSELGLTFGVASMMTDPGETTGEVRYRVNMRKRSITSGHTKVGD